MKVFLSRLLANSVLTSLIALSILLIIVWSTGRQLEFSGGALLSAAAILPGAIGLSFVVGSVVLVIKRAQQVVGLTQFVLLFLIMVPFERLDDMLKLVHYGLPIAPAAGALREAMIAGADISWNTMFLVFFNGFCYMIVGMVLFKSAITRGRRKGNLGWY